MQPAQGHIEQSIVVNAPRAIVYTEVNGFKSFNKWSPWYKIDPEAEYTFEGPESGAGAKMSWDGKKVRKGSQWIEESIENQKVKNALTYEGSDGQAHSEFILTPVGGGTMITWNFDRSNDDITDKINWVFMDVIINDMYAQGLLDLKLHVESIATQTNSSK